MEVNDVSFTEALRRLDAIRDRFTDRVMGGQVSVWAGSAISQKRFPNLGALLTALLCKLHQAIADPNDPADPAFVALRDIIGLAGVVGMAPPDPSDHIDTWPATLRRAVIDGLWSRYADVLAVPYRPGGTAKSLALDVLEIDALYADPDTIPDAEHRLLALLTQEGVFQHLITTNWDPLIERAHNQAANGTERPALRTVVFEEDLLGLGDRTPRLNKIHGCAERARQEQRARDLLVATARKILEWVDTPERRAVRQDAVTTARDHTVLYLGLSGQDANIRLSHIEARLHVDADQATGAPRVLFAEREVGTGQREILEAAYGDLFDGPAHDAIKDAALVPLYAKPLLGGLLAFVLREKLYRFADANPQPHERDLARRGIDALVDHVAAVADDIADPDRRWRYVSDTVARYVSSFNSVFRSGVLLDGPWQYHPVSAQPDLPVSSTDAGLALLIGILATGDADGLWNLEFTPSAPEQLRIHTPLEQTVPVFVVCAKRMTPDLLSFTPDHDDHLVVHVEGNRASGDADRPDASLRGDLLDRTTNPGRRHELYLDEVIADGDPVNTLRRTFYDLGLVN